MLLDIENGKEVIMTGKRNSLVHGEMQVLDIPET